MAAATPYDEMHAPGGSVRAPYRDFAASLVKQSPNLMEGKRAKADLVFRRVGITFAVYGDSNDGSGTKRLIPFDVIPRILTAEEWRQLEARLRQRVRALNLFLHDVYHDQNSVRAADGTGIADDKSIYPYVPQTIEFYLGEQPLLANVPTYRCREAEDLAYTLAHLDELVVDEVTAPAATAC